MTITRDMRSAWLRPTGITAGITGRPELRGRRVSAAPFRVASLSTVGVEEF